MISDESAGTPFLRDANETRSVSSTSPEREAFWCANESQSDSFAHQKSSISGDVDETLRVSFASRRNGVPADSSEIFDFRDTRTLRVLGTGVNRVHFHSTCHGLMPDGVERPVTQSPKPTWKHWGLSRRHAPPGAHSTPTPATRDGVTARHNPTRVSGAGVL